jgi:alpha-1,2-rhamnosyltransferase
LNLPDSQNRRPAIRRIFIDCTATCRHDANTGVQRVVRNLVNTSARIGPELGVACHGAAFEKRSGFVALDGLPVPAAVRSQHGQKEIPNRFQFRSKLKELLVAANLLGIARSVGQQLDGTLQRALCPVRRFSQRGIDFRPGDVLLLPDDSWNPNFPWQDVCDAQACGAMIGLLLHDLIPVQYPQIVGRPTHMLYCRWWDRVRSIADFIISVSRSVQDDIDAVEVSRRPDAALRAGKRRGFFRLGAELDGIAAGEAVRQQSVTIFGSGPERRTYLMVGMMSPRKNHGLALDAFDRLWEQNADVNLAIAGKYGWDCGSLQDRIRRHSQFGRRLFWIQDAGDRQLDYYYRHAAGLITTSCAEGFNLPIVEALQHGCPVLASDVPVHREVGGAYAAFFPTGDAGALAKLVVSHQRQRLLEGVKPPADFHWPDWSESCRELLRKVLDLSGCDALAGHDHPANRPANRGDDHHRAARAA